MSRCVTFFVVLVLVVLLNLLPSRTSGSCIFYAYQRSGKNLEVEVGEVVILKSYWPGGNYIALDNFQMKKVTASGSTEWLSPFQETDARVLHFDPVLEKDAGSYISNWYDHVEVFNCTLNVIPTTVKCSTISLVVPTSSKVNVKTFDKLKLMCLARALPENRSRTSLIQHRFSQVVSFALKKATPRSRTQDLWRDDIHCNIAKRDCNKSRLLNTDIDQFNWTDSGFIYTPRIVSPSLSGTWHCIKEVLNSPNPPRIVLAPPDEGACQIMVDPPIRPRHGECKFAAWHPDKPKPELEQTFARSVVVPEGTDVRMSCAFNINRQTVPGAKAIAVQRPLLLYWDDRNKYPPPVFISEHSTECRTWVVERTTTAQDFVLEKRGKTMSILTKQIIECLIPDYVNMTERTIGLYLYDPSTPQVEVPVILCDFQKRGNCHREPGYEGFVIREEGHAVLFGIPTYDAEYYCLYNKTNDPNIRPCLPPWQWNKQIERISQEAPFMFKSEKVNKSLTGNYACFFASDPFFRTTTCTLVVLENKSSYPASVHSNTTNMFIGVGIMGIIIIMGAAGALFWVHRSSRRRGSKKEVPPPKAEDVAAAKESFLEEPGQSPVASSSGDNKEG